MAHTAKSKVVQLSRFMNFYIQIFISTHEKISIHTILAKNTNILSYVYVLFTKG